MISSLFRRLDRRRQASPSCLHLRLPLSLAVVPTGLLIGGSLSHDLPSNTARRASAPRMASSAGGHQGYPAAVGLARSYLPGHRTALRKSLRRFVLVCEDLFRD